MTNKLILDHGSGGRISHRLVTELFIKSFNNPILAAMNDAARLVMIDAPLAVSTDTFTVDPIFFLGGDIGSIAVYGTVNDVAMLGAKPLYLTCGFILEEGLDIKILSIIVKSMAKAATDANVDIIAGDTKVVPRGTVDKIFINTTGIGRILVDPCPSGHRATAGDAVLLSGTVGEHGLSILAKRQGLTFNTSIASDAAPLHRLVARLITAVGQEGAIHVLRDPTRGGLATTLNEIAEQSDTCIEIEESNIPINPAVEAGCSLLGLDPLYLANEGKLVCILPAKLADTALEVLRTDPHASEARRIGTVHGPGNIVGDTYIRAGQVVMVTRLGGYRLLNMLEGEQLPRIC